jgi:hypothetical protein
LGGWIFAKAIFALGDFYRPFPFPPALAAVFEDSLITPAPEQEFDAGTLKGAAPEQSYHLLQKAHKCFTLLCRHQSAGGMLLRIGFIGGLCK